MTNASTNTENERSALNLASPNPYRIVRFAGETEADKRAQWLEYRNRGIGGSDAAAVLGVSPWKSPLSVWLEKRGEVEPTDLSDNQAVRWGTILEDPVANEFAGNHPELTVRRMNGVYVSVDHPHMFATVDRVVTREDGTRGILEVKTVGGRSAGAWSDEGGNDVVPVFYQAQILHYLAVTGFDFAWCAVLIAGQDYREIFVERNEEDIAFIIEREAQFWQMVERGEMPQIVGHADEAAALRSHFPESDDEFIDGYGDEELVSALERIQTIKEKVKLLDAEKRLHESTVKARIGEHKGVIAGGLKATWSRFMKSSLDTKSLKAEHPELVAKYTSESLSDGGLRISVAKEG